MTFDLISFLAGAVSTVIGSLVTAITISLFTRRLERARVIEALFGELAYNKTLIDEALAPKVDAHWSLLKPSLHFMAYEHAFSTGYLFSLPQSLYNPISDAYTIMKIIEREGYHPGGTAAQSFTEAEKRLNNAVVSVERYAPARSKKLKTAASTAAFASFGFALGYASNLLSRQILTIGGLILLVCAVAFVIFKNWEDSSQTIFLAMAIAILLTPKPLSEEWALVFFLIGFVFLAVRLVASRL